MSICNTLCYFQSSASLSHLPLSSSFGRLRPSDIHAPRGLQPLCRGVPEESVQHVDHEAVWEGTGERHLPHQQTLTD